jgi:hypothetical protein
MRNNEQLDFKRAMLRRNIRIVKRDLRRNIAFATRNAHPCK